MSIQDRKDLLVKLLNDVLARQDITYGELNRVIPFDDVEALHKLERKYPDLGIARYGTGREGVSFLSLIATITRVLCDDSLAFVIPEQVATADEANELIVKEVSWLSG